MELQHPISEEHEQQLKTALGLQPSDTIPNQVLEVYDAVRRTARRIGCAVSEHELVLAVMLTKSYTPVPATSVLDDCDKFVPGQRVVVKLGGKWRWAKYMRHNVSSKTVTVTTDDDGEVREFKAANVRLPNEDELKSIGEATWQQ